MVKEEQKHDVKVKIEQCNGLIDVKPDIKNEPKPEIDMKIEQTDPNETTDQKPAMKPEPNTKENVKNEKMDVKNKAEASGENEMQGFDKSSSTGEINLQVIASVLQN